MSKAFKTDPESFGNLALSPWITWASVSPLPKLLLCVSIWTQTQQERLQSVFPSASNHKVDLIFESRIGCGVSSYIISKVLPNVQIRTFDLNDDRLIASKHSASSFLQDFCHHVETHVGDSLVLIPEHLCRAVWARECCHFNWWAKRSNRVWFRIPTAHIARVLVIVFIGTQI
jgi:hypothetical protein